MSPLLLAVLLAVAMALVQAMPDSSTCVCTTVPCPVAGLNVLTEGNYPPLLSLSFAILLEILATFSSVLDVFFVFFSSSLSFLLYLYYIYYNITI